jgi:threonine aldolase
MKLIDLRSDTVTKPGTGMLNAMQHAVVGDDVFGEDPTVIELEHKLAGMFGMEAGLFCPSGTMTNQIAIRYIHAPPMK